MERSYQNVEKTICGKWQSLVEILAQFVEKTKQLQSHLEQGLPTDEDKRDAYIQAIDELLEERQQLLINLPNLAELEAEMKQQLKDSESQLNRLMNNHSQQIKQDIKTLQLKKQKNDYYSNPYGNIAADGMFLDKRK